MYIFRGQHHYISVNHLTECSVNVTIIYHKNFATRQQWHNAFITYLKVVKITFLIDFETINIIIIVTYFIISIRSKECYHSRFIYLLFFLYYVSRWFIWINILQSNCSCCIIITKIIDCVIINLPHLDQFGLMLIDI